MRKTESSHNNVINKLDFVAIITVLKQWIIIEDLKQFVTTFGSRLKTHLKPFKTDDLSEIYQNQIF